MSYNEDKRELLKLKQGIITESELIKEEAAAADKKHYEVKGFKNKLVNFLYLYKLQLIIGLFFVVIAAIFIYSAVSKEKADMRILAFSADKAISADLRYKAHDIELALERYTEDFDKNGKIHVDVYYVDMSPQEDATYYSINQTKLYSEIGLANAQIFIGDRTQLETVLGDQEESSGYEDLSVMYPDDPQVVDKYYYKIKGSAFSETAGYTENCPDDLYMVIRSNSFNGYTKLNDKIKEYHTQALSAFDNILNDNKINLPNEE